jgi:hypothetical protein
MRLGRWLTRWRVRIVLRKRHLGLEVTSVIKRVRVHDNKGNGPLEDVIVDELQTPVSQLSNMIEP